MNKKYTITLAAALLGFLPINAQNVGIGTATPTAKLHVNQTAGVDGILVDHAGAAGNSLELVPTNTANGSSALWIRNGSAGAGINNEMLNAASTSSSIISNNAGLGVGLNILQTNTGATGAGVRIDQDGTGAFSRGVDMYLDAANSATGYTLFHSGTGAGFYMELSEATNAAIGYDLRHSGTGRGTYTDLSNAANGSTGSALYHAGTGRGLYTTLTNSANAATGTALYHSGTGIGTEVGILNTASTNMASSIFHDGLGRGQQIVLGNTTTQATGLSIFHRGDGTGQYITVSDAAATRNSLGLIVNYNGTGGGTAGGGNAVEIQHYGNNGNAVDLFMGDPTAAAGPTNTTSEYASLSITHMATGTSPTAGLSKSAISASNNSADPTILVNNNGSNDGDGINVFITPVTANSGSTAQARGIYSQAVDANAGEGIGVYGFGGDMGVIGYASGGSGFGLYSFANSGSAGVKSFHIDHPLDPENKTLSHYSVESNEVLNMYRGVVQLDANGQAEVNLPDYFDATNTNPSYQLTAIGTATQPYIASEINNNKFMIVGAPNTKVSWTVYAQRNDPTAQYFMEKYNISESVRAKRPQDVGKYITPEAYGKDRTHSTVYDPALDKNYKERDMFVKQQKAMSIERIQESSKNSKGEEREEKEPKGQEVAPSKEVVESK
ncbi:autotransporter outer membrane beta-barrel domain-containing protein [Aureispira anguillae]|nr:hypothetical protein [Aureispira anguillae]